jgi:hypothetical protein
MESFQVIMLTGIRHSGKDTIADHLEVAHDYTKIAFADALKLKCSEIYNVPLYDFYYAKDEPCDAYPGFTPRDMCIQEANEAKAQDPDIWARTAGDAMRGLADGPLRCKLFVVSDFRHQNEYDALRRILPEFTFTVARVTRDVASEVLDPSDDPKNITSRIHVEFDNNGEIEDLLAQVDAFLDRSI